MIIYKATNIFNNKIYIGQTTNSLEYRRSQHNREVKNVKRKNTYFHNAINKYGFENFIFEEIDTASDINELNLKEQYWIKYYNSTNKEIGYNLDSGGLNCLKSQTTKQKIGKTTLIRWSDKNTASKMLNGLRVGTENWKLICENNKVEFVCLNCGKSIMLAPWEANKKKYCSLQCAGKMSGLKGVYKAREVKIHNNTVLKQEIAVFILNWVKENKVLVSDCPYNKIIPNLKPLINSVDEKYNIKDIRSLFMCFGVGSRKEFLKYLKDYIVKENIC